VLYVVDVQPAPSRPEQLGTLSVVFDYEFPVSIGSADRISDFLLHLFTRHGTDEIFVVGHKDRSIPLDVAITRLDQKRQRAIEIVDLPPDVVGAPGSFGQVVGQLVSEPLSSLSEFAGQGSFKSLQCPLRSAVQNGYDHTPDERDYRGDDGGG